LETEICGQKEEFSIFVPIAKANKEEHTVTGVVLQPEVTDAQGDIMSANVIKQAAHDFLSKYNKKTELGFMHKSFKRRFELLESYVAPMDFVLKSAVIKAGSWIVTVRVKETKVWKMIKDGNITGFSIGGKAKVVMVEAND